MNFRNIHFQAIAIIGFSIIHHSSAVWRPVAHRGVFHDRLDVYNTAENSVDSVIRALEMKGVFGVELDIQVAEDGVLLAFHDTILNRQTIKDNGRGQVNAISVALNHQAAPRPLFVQAYRAGNLVGTPMKSYGSGGRVVRTESKPVMQTLESTLSALKSHRPRAGFIVMLDCQTPYIADHAAGIIRKLGMQSTVYLKIWATRAINSVGVKYNGANTCYDYARTHGWGGINIIPEINELQINGASMVPVFGTNLKVGEYLDCWALAQRDHAANGAAIVPMVSGMEPNARNSAASEAARQAMVWAQSHGRKKVSVIVMPDACTISTNTRRVWRFTGDRVGAFSFDYGQYIRRKGFCDSWADYCVVDVMGDFENYYASPDYEYYLKGLCAA